MHRRQHASPCDAQHRASLVPYLFVALVMMSYDFVESANPGDTLLASSVYGTTISSVAMWSGLASGHNLTFVGLNCIFPDPVSIDSLRAQLVEVPPSKTYGWDSLKSTIITTDSQATSFTGGVCPASYMCKSVTVRLQPAPGFVLTSSILVRWVVGGNCSAPTQPITISANTDGGYATVLFCTDFTTTATCASSSVANEYDIQNRTLTLLVGLQYNAFLLTGTPSVTVTGITELASGWSFTRYNNYTLIGTHSSVPTFNIAAGQSVSLTVAIPATQTFLGIAPSPSATTFTVDAVDGNPVAFCILSNNLTDRMIRLGQGSVDITLYPSTKDYFNVYASNVTEQSVWNGTIAAASLPAGVTVTYRVVSTTTMRLTLSSASTFFMTDASSVVFSPRPAALRSMTAGCGVVQLPISPAPIDMVVGLTGQSSINITELDIQFRVTNLTATIPIASKMFRTTLPPCTTAFRNSPVCFDVMSDYSSPPGAIETRFVAALAAANVSIIASAPTENSVVISIPPLPTYNIDHDKIECIVVRLPAGAMKSNVAPNTTSLPTFCITGVPITAAVTFRSSGSNVTDAAGLWDNGDIMRVALTGGVWNTSAVWVEGTPLLNSSNGGLSNETLLFSPINFANITFSSDQRIAFVPIVPCVGLSVIANETGLFRNYSSLIADRTGVNTTRVTFAITQPNSTVVGFTCSNICTMEDTAVDSVYVNETQVRNGFNFTVQSQYDVLVDQSTLTQQRWSLFTRNVTALTSYPGVSLSVVRVNAYTALFTFAKMPNFDITADDVAVIYLNTSFLRNKLVKSAIRGFLFFKANVPQPTCSLVSFTPSISERAIQSGDVAFFFRSTLPFVSSACSSLASGDSLLAYTVSSNLPLNITVGNCSKDFNATGGLLPLVIRQNSSYDVSSTDTLLFSLNRTFFTVLEQCAFDPSVDIPVLPANTHFTFSYNTTVSSTNSTPLEVPLPYVANPSYGVLVSERLFRRYGMTIRVNFTGELIKSCSFYLQYSYPAQDQLATTLTNFAATYGLTRSVNMTATGASNCVVNVSTSAIFIGTLLPKSYDIAVVENITFYVPLGVGFGAALPVGYENTVTFTPVAEDTTATLRFNDSLSDNAFHNRTMRSLPLTSLGVLNPTPTVEASWSYVRAVARAEVLSRGSFSTTFELYGDRWTTNAPDLLVNSLSVLVYVNSTLQTQVPQTTSFSSIRLLFPPSSARIDFNATTLRSTLVFTAQADPSFFLTTDAYFMFSIPSFAINSGLVPNPSWVGINVTSAPPSLQASGPAFAGGTRRLLLGSLYLIVRLLDDNFVASSISGPTVCPKAFDTCSIVVDDTLRYLNITFPAQDLVIFTRTVYSINLTESNVASQRPINNSVSFTLDVESGILSEIKLGTEVASGGNAVSEDLWRNGGVGSLSFILKGDSFVDSAKDIIAALMQRTTCSPASDAYGFCSRLQYMLPGTVNELEVSRQSIQITLQPDRLFDVYRDETVTLAFGGVGTTSTFAPIFLANLSFVVRPTSGVATMSTTFPTTSAAPLSASDLRDGTKQIVWVFTLAGERWNVGSTFPYVATPAGVSLRQLVVAAFSSSVNATVCAKCFNALRTGLFADDVVLSSDQRTLQITMVANALYDTQYTEAISIQFTDTRLFLSGIVPTQSNIATSDWQLVVAPSGSARLELNRISPTSVTLDATATTSSTFVVAISQDVLQTTGVNVTVRMASAPTYFWNGAKFNGTGGALYAALYTTSSSAVASEPTGFLALRGSMVATYVTLAASTNVTDVTFALTPSAEYSLTNGAGETIIYTMPSAWTAAFGVNSTAPTTVSPSSLQFQVSVTNSLVIVLVKKSDLTDTCPTVGTMRNFLINVTSLLQTTVAVVSSATSVLSSTYCNVTLRLQSSDASNALTTRARLVGMATVDLVDCCSIAIAYPPTQIPTDDTLLAAMNTAPPPPPPSDDTAEQLTWVFVSIGVLIAILAAYYVYRNHISGDAFSGTSRVRAEELHDVWTMKLVIDEEDEDVLQQRTREQRQQAIDLRAQRVHWDAEGNPTLSALNSAENTKGSAAAIKARQVATPSAMNDAANETVFAGQPNRGRDIYHHASSVAVNVELVDLPILAQEDDIPIAPNAIDGMVMQGNDSSANNVSHRQVKRLPRLRRPSENARFELL